MEQILELPDGDGYITHILGYELPQPIHFRKEDQVMLEPITDPTPQIRLPVSVKTAL